jgi:predicted TIM-barrel fold metal-dependent hydrolase
MVVDCHTHLFPLRLARRIRGFFDRHLTEGALAYDLDHRSLLDAHAADGISVLWNLPYAHRAGIAAQLNDNMIEIASEFAEHPVRLVSGCTVHPADDDPAGIVARAHDRGARVLKLHCSVGNYELTDPRLGPVLDMAADRRLPVTVHAGHAITGRTAAVELGAVGATAEAHPDTTFVLAHCGHDAYADAIGLLERHANLHADLTPVIDEPVPLTATDAARFADRLLFGSDAPNTGRSAGVLLEDLRSTGIDDGVFERITSTNALALVP